MTTRYLSALSADKLEKLRKRFFKYVDKDPRHGGCWIWTSGRLGDGYGAFTVKAGWKMGAHRVAWELEYGDIPEGLIVRHKVCDNRLCTNVAHLAVGTQKDNIHDMIEKGRQRFGEPGSARPQSKLTEPGVEEILQLLMTTDLPHSHIARRFHVSTAAVGGIAIGITWKHVPRPVGYLPRKERKAMAATKGS